MAEDLYKTEPVFRAALDECAKGMMPQFGMDIRTLLYPEVRNEAAELKLTDTENTQPVLFAIEYALAKLLMSWGIEPSGMIGHSLGEYTAARIAGVITGENVGIVCTRARVMQQQERGAMVSIRMSADKLSPFLGRDLAIAAYNAPELRWSPADGSDWGTEYRPRRPRYRAQAACHFACLPFADDGRSC